MKLHASMLAAGLSLVMTGAIAQDSDHGHDHHDHDHHSAEAGDITVTHPWARAASVGGNTFVFMEFHNAGGADELEGAHTEIAESARIVGISFAGGAQSTQPFDSFDIPHGDFDFDPAGVAILLEGLTTNLAEGEVFELELIFHHAGKMDIQVEVEAANATQHSHAGHSH